MSWFSLLDEGDLGAATPTAISGVAGGAGASGAIARSDHQHAFGPTQDLSMGGFKLSSLGTPLSAADAATKAYVDSLASGVDWKASVRLATAAAPAAYVRTGNVITFSAVGSQSVDGLATVLADRILLKDGAAGSDNGLYEVTTKGTGGIAEVWTRTTDADVDAEVTPGIAAFVEVGTVNADSGWILTTDGTIVLNTTALTFTQFTGLGQIVAGPGLSKTGNQLDVNVDNVTIEIISDILRVKALGIDNSHVAAGAAIVGSKLDFTSSVPTSFHTQVRTSRLDQMAAPTAELDFSDAAAVVNGLKPKTYANAGARPTEQTGRIIYVTSLLRLQVSR